jgi:diguanylate cyclase (GGDEF)-like protein
MTDRPEDDDAPPDREAPGAPPPDLDRTLISTTRIEATSRRLATLVVVKGVEIGRHYPLRRNRVVLGRGENADVMIPHKEISRAHAMIEALRLGAETVYRLSDLGSTNRVFVNGMPVERHVLGPGDKIQLGDAVLKFELLDAIDEKFHTEIRNRIQYDELTGLLTYESFRTALQWELERLATSVKGCSLVMMDLDDFKKLNDTYGHLAGSFVLREVGASIRDNLRQFDVAARYGGEEFVAYLPETDPAEALIAAERLRRVLADGAFVHQDRAIRLTISMGLAHFPDEGDSIEALVELADRRLYRAKRDGKNRVYGSD